ncbi:MAG: tetratricopeptide repeat protein [Okeania sp. SIO2H7]|nr:tetratricopeptide repeat protein [Okeania sp. SIO2H7]
MKLKILINFVSLIALIAVSLVGGKSSILLAKTICPENGDPCYEEGDRGSSISIQIIGPTVGNLLPTNNRPNLSWEPEAGAESYFVSITDFSGIILELETGDTQIIYPEDKPPLEPDKDYTLTVETLIGDTAKSGEVNFRLLGEEEAEKIEAAAAEIRNQNNLTAEEKVVKIAEMYEDKRLYSEAIALLNNSLNEGKVSPEIYQTLGKVYREAGLSFLAETPYQEALELAEDKNAIAEAQVGLARVNISLENWEEAISWLEKARANYREINNRELAAQLAQFLGEVLVEKGDRPQAINWYRQAAEEYENLGELERLNYVEEILERLNKR